MSSILKASPPDVEQPSLDEALKIVAQRDDSSWARELLRQGANAHLTLDSGVTLLHQAAKKGHENITALLLEQGLDPDIRDDMGNTPLHEAATHNEAQVARLLIRHGASLNPLNRGLQTPLDRVTSKSNATGNRLVEEGAVQTISYAELIKVGSLEKVKESLQKMEYGKETIRIELLQQLLPPSIKAGQTEMVRFLFRVTGQLSEPSQALSTPFLKAVKTGGTNMIRLFLTNGVDLNAPVYKTYPLHQAVLTGNQELVRFLLEEGSKMNVTNTAMETPLDLARQHNHLKIEALIREKGALSKEEMINLIEQGKRKKFIEFFQTCAYYPDMDNGLPARLFEMTAETGQKRLLTLLYRKTGREVRGVPLHKAVQSGQQQIVEQLLRYGAEINGKNERYETPLHIAVKQVQVKLTALLLKQGADPLIPTREGLTPLDFAIQAQNQSLCKQLVEAGAELDNKTGPRQMTPLHQAAWDGSQEIAQYLVNQGATLSVTDTGGATPLHYAAQQGYTSICRTFVNTGQSLNVTDHRGHTPLHWAVRDSQQQVIRWIAESGANLNIGDQKAQTPLHWAVKLGSPPVSSLLLQEGALPNIRDNQCRTPMDIAQADTLKAITRLLREYDGISSYQLDTAMQVGDMQLVNTFLNTSKPEETSRCPVRTRDMQWGPSRLGEGTLLHSAVLRKNKEVCRMLLEKGWNIDARAANNLTPLLLAVMTDRDNMARWLVNNKADLGIIGGSPHRMGPLHLAARQGDLELVKFLIQEGATINLMSSELKTPWDKAKVYDHPEVKTFLRQEGGLSHQQLRDAFQQNIYDTIRHFLQTCSNPNIRQEHGHPSWLHFAVYYGDTTTCQFLIDRGFSVDTSYDGQAITPLMAAVRAKNQSIAQLFLDHGADPNKYGGYQNWRPLHIAVDKDLPDFARFLIRNGADVNARAGGETSSQKTPLHFAIEKGNESMVRLLLEKGADPNIPDRKGNTALHTAIQHTAGKELCQRLLEQGAHLSRPNQNGETPYILAVKRGQRSISNLIWEKSQ